MDKGSISTNTVSICRINGNSHTLHNTGPCISQHLCTATIPMVQEVNTCLAGWVRSIAWPRLVPMVSRYNSSMLILREFSKETLLEEYRLEFLYTGTIRCFNSGQTLITKMMTMERPTQEEGL